MCMLVSQLLSRFVKHKEAVRIIFRLLLYILIVIGGCSHGRFTNLNHSQLQLVNSSGPSIAAKHYKRSQKLLRHQLQQRYRYCSS